MKLPTGRAEKLKLDHGSAIIDPMTADEVILLDEDASFAGQEIEKSLLHEVIHMRVREIFEHVRTQLAEGGQVGRVSAGIFLCGGCSFLQGIDKVAEEILELPVQRASSAPISGLTATFENPQFAVPIGLIRYAQILENERPSRGAFARLGRKLSDMLGSVRLSFFS